MTTILDEAEASLGTYNGPDGKAMLTYAEAQAVLNLMAWARTVREAFDNEMFSEWVKMKRKNYEEDRKWAKARYEYLFPENNQKERDDGYEASTRRV